MNIFYSSLSGNELTANRHFRTVLERMGHRVFYFTTPSRVADERKGLWLESGFAYESTFEGLMQIAGFKPDFFLYMEPDGLIPFGMEKADFPTACIISDTHRWLEARQKLSLFFDHVFLFHRNYLGNFTAHPASHVHWMPYACDLEFFHPVQVEKDLDIAFIGKTDISAERKRLLRLLAQKYLINEDRFYFQKEIPEIYSRARIVLNLPLGDDLNYRTFEALSCGSMLLTRRINNGQELLFTEGEHYAAFQDEQELFEKIGYYLAHPLEREQIAKAGLEEVRKKHSLDLRVAEMLEIIRREPALAAPIRKYSYQDVNRLYAWLYEYWRAPEAGLRIFQKTARDRKADYTLLAPAARSILRVLFRSG
jgi:hypothetical protein